MYQDLLSGKRHWPLIAALAVASIAIPAAGKANANSDSLLQVLRGSVQQRTITSEIKTPKIQLALILDTSNSMDGLIDQTRNQMWQVVNEFSSATQNGNTPTLEIALFEYGNDGISVNKGYVRRLNGFTGELDAVSASLFALSTNGGAEYSGYAIKTAVESLQWSRADSDIKAIFIAGNEPFNQGPVNYRNAIELALGAGIAVNTIHAGSYQNGIDDGWQRGAQLAGGDYLSIDADRKIVHLVTPQDAAIADLNEQLNQTYLPYGDQGTAKLERQLEQDSLSDGISAGLLSKRAKSKSSSLYRNGGWDLVDAFDEGRVDTDALAAMAEEELPAPMQSMSSAQRLDYVNTKAAEREQIQQQIGRLSKQRDAYVTEQKRLQAAAAPSISDALTNAIKKQARQKNFEFAE